MKTLDFKSAFVPSGKKVTNESAPLLTLTSLYNGFKLNNKAAKLLGVSKGDRVVMFDMIDPNDPCEQEERYFIAAGFERYGEEQGAILGATRAFNYSSIYGTILAGEVGLESITREALTEKGLLENTGYTDVSTKTITMELVPFQDGAEIEVFDDVEPFKLYRLTNFKEKAHTPKSMKKEEEVVEEVNNIEE